MKTLENWLSGGLGKLLVVIGIICLFKAFWFGLIVIAFGCYLKYKSKTYVHGRLE